MSVCVCVFFFFSFFSFSLLNFLVGQAGADKGEPVVSRHIADFWQNSPSSRKFTHFLAPGQAVLVGLGMAFPSVRKMACFSFFFFFFLLSSVGQGMESSCMLGQDCRKESKFGHGERFLQWHFFDLAVCVACPHP